MSTIEIIGHQPSGAGHHETDAGAAARATERVRVWTVGFAAGAAAAAATSLTAIVAAGVGDEISIGGEAVPASGFAFLTLIGAVFGVALAKLTQRARRPRRLFVRITVTLTALSIIPDLVVDATWTTRFVLAATHVIAAAIIVPALARRLDA